MNVLQGFTTVQMQMVEDNTEFVQQREKEVASIVRSITELNEIFKDLASMIVDQVHIFNQIYSGPVLGSKCSFS